MSRSQCPYRPVGRIFYDLNSFQGCILFSAARVWRPRLAPVRCRRRAPPLKRQRVTHLSFHTRLFTLLPQMTTSAAAVAAYESSWGYAEESGPAGAARHAAAAAAAPPPGLSDFSEQLAELVAAQRAVAAAAAAVRSYSEAMGYADAGCVQRTVSDGRLGRRPAVLLTLQSAVACGGDAGRDACAGRCRSSMTCPRDITAAKRARAIPSQFACTMHAHAPPPCSPSHAPLRQAGAVPAEGLPELADLSDRLAELTQSFCVAPAVPSQWQYAQPGAARCGACADVLPSLADMSERLLELVGGVGWGVGWGGGWSLGALEFTSTDYGCAAARGCGGRG